jgi:hypothetical protein
VANSPTTSAMTSTPPKAGTPATPATAPRRVPLLDGPPLGGDGPDGLVGRGAILAQPGKQVLRR